MVWIVTFLEGTAVGAWYIFPALRTILLSSPATKIAVAAFIANALSILQGWQEFKEGIAAHVLNFAGIEITAGDLSNKEAWKVAVGKRVAELTNARFSTNFNSFYPLENMVTQIKDAILQDAINAVNGKATKLMDATTANQLVQQITSAYRQNHNLPFVGAGVVLPVSPARQNNKSRQAKYRNNHERVMAWETADNNAILEAFKLKIQTLNDARIEYNAAKALYNAALKQQPQNASQVASANALMLDKKAIFDDAKLA